MLGRASAHRADVEPVLPRLVSGVAVRRQSVIVHRYLQLIKGRRHELFHTRRIVSMPFSAMYCRSSAER